MSVLVLLTPDEIAWATHHGKLRDRRSRKFHYRKNGGTDESNSLWHNVMGMLGELACAKAWGVRHTATDKLDRDEGDVLGRFVRTTKPGGGIPVRPDERDHLAGKVLVLVYDRRPEMEIVGWAFGRDVTQKYFWRGDWRAPAWCLPGYLVRTLETLPEGA